MTLSALHQQRNRRRLKAHALQQANELVDDEVRRYARALLQRLSGNFRVGHAELLLREAGMTRPAFKPVKPRAVGTPKAAISELVAQAGGVERVMVRLGIGKSEGYAYTDPQSDRELSFARVAALTAPGCTAGVEYLAALAGGVFLPVPAASSAIGALTADALRKHGAAAAELVEALTDDRITLAEARAALPEVEAAARAVALLLVTLTEIAAGREVQPPD